MQLSNDNHRAKQKPETPVWKRRLKSFAKWSGITIGLGAVALCGTYAYQVGPHTPKYNTAAEMAKDKPLMTAMIKESNARTQRPDLHARKAATVVTVEDLKQNVVSELKTGFEANGLEYLKSLLRKDWGLFKLQIALSDRGFFDYFKGMFEEEGEKLAKDYFDGTKPGSPLLDILADRDLRGILTKMMKTHEGQACMNELAATTYGDHLVGMLLGGKGGPQLVLDLLSTHEGLVTVDAIIGGMARADPIRTPPELPPFTPTPEGEAFKTKLQTPEGTAQLNAEMATDAGRQRNVDLFDKHEPESRSTLREIIATEDGREAMATIMQTEGGQAFLQELGKKGLGQKIGGDDLWLSPDGRSLVARLLKTEEGKAAIIKLVTGFGVFSEALASLVDGMPKYEGAPPAPATNTNGVPNSP
jgi:hypothetical protein